MQAQAKFRQGVVQIGLLIQGRHGFRAAILGVDDEIPLPAKAAQAFPVFFAQGFQNAEDEHAAGIVHGHLDLRYAVGDGQAGNEGGKRLQGMTDLGMQHFAAVHVRHEAGAAFTKTHQHPPFPGHILHAQTGLAPVAPGAFPHQGRKPAFRLHLADMGEGVRQGLLLVVNLLSGVQVLQAATAAQAEMGAARADAGGAGLQHLHHLALVMALAPARVAEQHLFPRQGAVDEGGLAFHPGHSTAIVAESVHPGFFWLLWQALTASSAAAHQRGSGSKMPVDR